MEFTDLQNIYFDMSHDFHTQQNTSMHVTDAV